MARHIPLHTTEDGVWVLLPFRVQASNLPKFKARGIAIEYRLKGYMARVRREGKRYLVATHKPRRRAAGGRELCR